MFQLLTPHLRIASVRELSPQRLDELGLRALLLDVDCTLKRYPATEAAPGVAEWLAELRSAGFGLCLVSNGWGNRIRPLADALKVPFVAWALKPLPFGCQRAMKRMGFQRRRTAMVGDQLFADVMAARLAGLMSILVEPIHPEEEPWFTRLKRRPERYLLRRMGNLA